MSQSIFLFWFPLSIKYKFCGYFSNFVFFSFSNLCRILILIYLKIVLMQDWCIIIYGMQYWSSNGVSYSQIYAVFLMISRLDFILMFFQISDLISLVIILFYSLFVFLLILSVHGCSKNNILYQFLLYSTVVYPTVCHKICSHHFLMKFEDICSSSLTMVGLCLLALIY